MASAAESDTPCGTFGELLRRPFAYANYVADLSALVKAVRAKQAADTPSDAGGTLRFAGDDDFGPFVAMLAMLTERLTNGHADLVGTALSDLSESAAPLLGDMVGVLANCCLVSKHAVLLTMDKQLHKIFADCLTSPRMPDAGRPACARLLANVCNMSALSERTDGAAQCVHSLCRAAATATGAKLLKHVLRALRYFGSSVRALRMLLQHECAAAVCSALRRLHTLSANGAVAVEACATGTGSAVDGAACSTMAESESSRRSLLADCVALMGKLAGSMPTAALCGAQIAALAEKEPGAATALVDIGCSQLEAGGNTAAWTLLETLCAESSELCYAERGVLQRMLLAYRQAGGGAKAQLVGVLAHFCRPGRSRVMVEAGLFDILLSRYADCVESGDDADMRFTLTKAFKRLVNDRTALDYVLSWRGGHYLTCVASALRHRVAECRNTTRPMAASGGGAPVCTVCAAAPADTTPALVPLAAQAKRRRVDRTESLDSLDDRDRLQKSASQQQLSPTPPPSFSPPAAVSAGHRHGRAAYSLSPPPTPHSPMSPAGTTPESAGSGQYSPVVAPSPASSCSSMDWQRARQSTCWDSPYHGHSANLWMSDSWRHGDARAGAAYLDAMTVCWMCAFEQRWEAISAHGQLLRALVQYVACEGASEGRVVRGLEHLIGTAKCTANVTAARVPQLIAAELCDALTVPAGRRPDAVCYACSRRHDLGAQLLLKFVDGAQQALAGMTSSIASAARRAADGHPVGLRPFTSLCHVAWSERQRNIHLVGTGYLRQLCAHAVRTEPPHSLDTDSLDVDVFLALFAAGANMNSLDAHLRHDSGDSSADCACAAPPDDGQSCSESMVTFRHVCESGAVLDTVSVERDTLVDASAFYMGMLSQDRFSDSAATQFDYAPLSRCVGSHMPPCGSGDNGAECDTAAYSDGAWQWLVFKSFVRLAQGRLCASCARRRVDDGRNAWRLWLDLLLLAECLLAPHLLDIIVQCLRACPPSTCDDMAAAAVALYYVADALVLDQLSATVFATLCRRCTPHMFVRCARRLRHISSAGHDYYARFIELYEGLFCPPITVNGSAV